MDSSKSSKIKMPKITGTLIILLLGYMLFPYIFPPQIIAIPYSQEYTGWNLQEYFVIVHPPRTMQGIKQLITDYDNSHPVIAPTPPLDMNKDYVYGYSRSFFKESEAFPADITFSDSFRPSDILTEEYNLKDRIGFIGASAFGDKTYRINLLRDRYSPIWGWETHVLDTLDYKEKISDPTINGLYNNMPAEMIPYHLISKW
jgi:hypothetical protein